MRWGDLILYLSVENSFGRRELKNEYSIIIIIIGLIFEINFTEINLIMRWTAPIAFKAHLLLAYVDYGISSLVSYKFICDSVSKRTQWNIYWTVFLIDVMVYCY